MNPRDGDRGEDSIARAATLNRILGQIGELNRRIHPAGKARWHHSTPLDPARLKPVTTEPGPASPVPREPIRARANPASPGPAGHPEEVARAGACQPADAPPPGPSPRVRQLRTSHWRIGAALEAFGLLPTHASRIVAELESRHGPRPPESFHDEVALGAGVLRQFWKPVAASAVSPPSPVHLFLGAPGVGKTTCLRKWLAQSVLLGSQSAHVWRLDGRQANTAEVLSLYADMLGVPVHRAWTGDPLPEADLHLVDLPGVDWRDAEAMEELAVTVRALGNAEVHLVLNAAYDIHVLFDQIAAFRRFPTRELIFTHLDEETRRGKLWNFLLGTNDAIGFLSAGQNVPGEFHVAAPELLLPGASGLNARVYAPDSDA